MSPLRVGLVGAGAMGRLHAQTVLRAQACGLDCTLVGITDRHPGRAARLSDELGLEPVESGERLVERADVGIVAVPTGSHREVASALLSDGLDLLVEKPLAASVTEGQELVEQARRLGRILQVGHVEWYNGAWREAARRVGRIRGIEVERSAPRGERGLDIDVIQDLMLHDLDWVTRWVGEEGVGIRARGRCLVDDRLDEVEAHLTFRSGVQARLWASRAGGERRRVARFEGSDGVARADLVVRPGSVPASEAAPDASVRVDPLTAQWRDFVRAVQERTEPINSGGVGVAALTLVERVREAVDLDRLETKRDDDPRIGR
ncbi:MAG: Gfo/Idh/MocA family protein [bacterium]